jgi:glutathione S-transferase
VCQYLVDKYQCNSLRISHDDPDFASYLNWLHHADATLTFPQTVALRYTILEPGRAENAAEDYAKWYLARLRLLDNTLGDGREFLVGGRFTIADICIAYALLLGKTVTLNSVALSESYKPHTAAYLERMTARPAFKSALAKQEKSLGVVSLLQSKLITGLMFLRRRLVF